jgi:phosphate acetyltransferase
MEMNKYQERILNMGKDSGARIILPESKDKRVQEAIIELNSLGFQVVYNEDFQDHTDIYMNYLSTLPFTDNWPSKNLSEYLKDPLHFSLAMVACNDADGVVAGAATSSSEVIRTAIRVVGIHPSSNWVSSIFFLISPCGDHAYTFADCAVIPEPDSKQLAVIGGDSADFHHLLTGEISKVAFLSFSTKGSASHYRIERVQKGVEIFGKQYPHIPHDGELQVDAAIIQSISQMKAPKSPIAGEANVLIFPNLDAGNIAYKIAQHMGGYSAWGPLLQGLNKPVHDLSRGCSVDDIINVASITALQGNPHAHV